MSSLLYIGGFGRSGSTLLERILGAHSRVLGLGEIEQVTRRADIEDVLCSCGEPLRRCRVWGPVLSTLRGEFDFATVRREQDRADSWFPGRLAGKAPGGDAYSEYDRFNRRLFELLTQRGSHEKPVLIDSSKTARVNALRPASLVRADIDIRFLHLVRDGRGCMWSYLNTGSNRRLEAVGRGHVSLPGLRTAFSWRLANCAAERFGEKRSESYLRVRYEDLTSDTERTLRSIGEFVGLDLEDEIRALRTGKPLAAVHQVAGNRMRTSERLRIAADRSWESHLSSRHRLLFRLVDGRLARRFGYEP